MPKEPSYRITSWKPDLAGDFLKSHDFIRNEKLDGDDCLWIGKKPNGEDSQVAYPVIGSELTSGTMRDSVMNQSGYSKKHWDLWRSMRKTDRKRRKCCP